jgi:hypothetical protein
MTTHQIISAALISVSMGLTAIHPSDIGSTVAVVASFVLYAFTVFIEKRDSSQNDKYETRIKAIENKLENIAIAKGFGR